ncbi:MAG: CPBP family glutamic-type intramembrane protease [Solirubrobacteraceae bacterium]
MPRKALGQGKPAVLERQLRTRPAPRITDAEERGAGLGFDAVTTVEPAPSTDRHSASGRPRVPPTLARGLAVVAMYAVVVIGVQFLSGVDYEKLNASSSNVVEFVIVPVGLGIVAVLALTARWDWWQQVFIERPRLTAPRWLWLIPALFVITIVGGVASAPWGDWSTGVVLALLAGTLMVGIGEEIVFRGYLLVAARARYSEVGAWFVTSALFGLFHGTNLLNGAAFGPTMRQIVVAFILGGALYLIRRVSGLLVVAMVIHGLWDFSTLVKGGPGEAATNANVDTASVITALPGTVAGFVTIAALFLIFRVADTPPTLPPPGPE